MITVIMSVVVLGTTSLVFGLVLLYANVKFKVEQDPKLEAIVAALPSANCGGCGFPGCGGFAEAVLNGEADPSGCPLGGAETSAAIGEILGVKVKDVARQTAFIRCAGGQSNSNFLYNYAGMNSCTAAMQLAGGGSKACTYGCLGGGSCLSVCDFDAVIMEDGIAKIDNEKCVACGKCVSACPKDLIVMVPQASNIRVACNSNDTGKTVRGNCKVGCISCRICQKNCDYAAINVFDLLAEVDYNKCTDCGACKDKCPTKCIGEFNKSNIANTDNKEEGEPVGV